MTVRKCQPLLYKLASTHFTEWTEKVLIPCFQGSYISHIAIQKPLLVCVLYVKDHTELFRLNCFGTLEL